MDRLIATNSVSFANRDTAPGSGTPQYATSGVPGTTPATVWPAYMFNSIMDELMAIQTAAGVTADKTNWAQIIQSLRRLFGGNLNSLTASGTLTVDQAGTVQVDATAGNVVLTLPAATALTGLTYRFVRKDASANTVTIQRAGSDTIIGFDATPTITSFQLPYRGAALSITADGVSNWVRHSALPFLSGSQAFTGSGNFTPGANVFRARYRIWGASGGSAYCTGAGGGGGGGGGGGYCEGFLAVAPGVTVAITIGAAGTAGSSGGGTPGGAGGTTSVAGGGSVTGGGGGIQNLGAGGAGGVASGGTINLTGQAGGNGGTNIGGPGGGCPGGASGTSWVSNGSARISSFPGGAGSGAGSNATDGAAGQPGYVVMDW